ncbi:MAG: hypothetical protein ACI4J7_10670, partial [Ruminiclostridium sp.]
TLRRLRALPRGARHFAAASPPPGASRPAARSAAACGGFAASRRFAPCRAERGILRRLRRLPALRALPRGARLLAAASPPQDYPRHTKSRYMCIFNKICSIFSDIFYIIFFKKVL